MTGRRLTAALLALAALIGVFATAWWVLIATERAQLENQASLYRTALDATLGKHAAIPQILSEDPLVQAGLTGQDRTVLNARLERFAETTGLEAIYLMDETGLTVAASNHGAPVTFLGRNYGFRPYFQEALAGNNASYFAVGATTSLPGFFLSSPVTQGDADRPAGVIAVKVDVSDLSQAGDGDEAVIVADPSGVVLFSSDTSWNFRTLDPLDDARMSAIRTSRQFGDAELSPLDWTPRSVTAVSLDGRRFVHSVQALDRVPWTIHVLSPSSTALQRALLVTGAVAGGLMLLFGGGVLRRLQRTRAALVLSQAERRELAATNEALAREIEERRAAERRLESAQGELARASKLAALGQLAASVTHELGQPLSAMKNHLTAAELSTPPEGRDGRLITRLTGLVTRMETIAKDLRFFARPVEDQTARLDMRDVWAGAAELIAPDLTVAGIPMIVDTGAGDLTVMGNKLRLEQVIVNLLKNAKAALAEQDDPAIRVTITGGDDITLTVRDNGPGIGDKTIEDLQEPFHTTRASGEGMGLGLAISASIVADHNGRLSAENDGTGAVFTLTLPRAAPIQAVA